MHHVIMVNKSSVLAVSREYYQDYKMHVHLESWI
jgi:hypothetical protein